MVTWRSGISIGFAFLLLFSSFVMVMEINSVESREARIELVLEKSDTHTPHDAILITSDEEFDSMATAEGWNGDGSSSNPYRITGYLLTDPLTQPIRIWNTEVHWIFENNIIEGGGLCGSFIVNTKNGMMTNNTFRFRHNGMAFQDVENLLITENYIHNNTGHGLEFLGYSRGVTVRNNRIVNNRVSGILLPAATDCQIVNNTIIDNYNQGISVPSGMNVTISNNDIKGHPENGIISGTSNCTILGNTVEFSEMYGVALTSGSYCEISGNIIKDSDNYGLYLSSPTSNTTVTENSFIGNGEDCQVKDAGSENKFFLNFYDDWISPDSNSDDIVDSPYVFDGQAGNSDPFPLVSPELEIPDIPTDASYTSTTMDFPLEVVAIASVAVIGILLTMVFFFKKKS
ncbi:MAG: right-handed parallel beta-helix repeat-containing protein [Candidatus Thorarchaeota archaeon]